MTEIVKVWNSSKVRIRETDRYVCLSDLAKASNKRLHNWIQNKSANEYLQALEEATGIPVAQLIEITDGKPTYAHPKVALRFAQWCSAKLAVKVDTWLDELLTTGSVSLIKQEPIRQLPQRDAIEYINASKDVETINNSTLQQLLRDELIDELSVKRGQKALPSIAKEYTIAKVRAKELGYSSNEIKNGSGLGNFVAKQLKEAFIERIGKYSVKHYLVCDELDTAIHSYFGMKKAIG